MAQWRYISEEDFAEAVEKAPSIKAAIAGDESVPHSIYPVESGTVSKGKERLSAPSGWFVKLLDSRVDADWCYLAERLTVLYCGFPSVIKKGTPVALFPPTYLEKAREAQP